MFRGEEKTILIFLFLLVAILIGIVYYASQVPGVYNYSSSLNEKK